MLLKLHMILYRFFVLTLLLVSCRNEASEPLLESAEGKITSLKYAKGFSVIDFETHKIIRVSKPWPGSKKMFQYAIVNNENKTIPTLLTHMDAVIQGQVNNVVVTSTTHIPHLELLGEEKSLSGFPGTDYISSKKTRTLVDNGLVRDLGKNENINTEVLLEINPDVVIGFGVEGINRTFETIKKAGIPVFYNGDWVESSPLAKAEWIKFFGALFNKESEADSIFNKIEQDYFEAKAIAQKASIRPTVLCGAMHKDIWYLPNGSSPEAQLMEDANLDYLWSDTTGNGSLALSFEVVYDKARNADLWLSPSYYSSRNQLEEASALYTNFKAFTEGSIYSFSGTTGTTGGVLYYEIGAARPDLVLKDIIKICHPELLKNYSPFFFQRLE